MAATTGQTKPRPANERDRQHRVACVGPLTFPLLVAAAIVISALASSVQAVTGFGFALVAIPLMSIVLGPIDAVIVVTVVSLALTTVAAHRERIHVLRAPAYRMILGGVVGMPLGLLALISLDVDTLRIVIAGVVTAMVLALAVRARFGSGTKTQWAAGVASGALLTSTGLNGPPVVLALQSMEVSPVEFRATLQRIFQGQDLIAVLAFVAVGRVDLGIVLIAAASTAGIPLGWSWGNRVFGRISPEIFRRVVLVTLLVAAGTSVFMAL